MSLKNRYENVIIRDYKSLGLSHNALDYVLKLENTIKELRIWLEENIKHTEWTSLSEDYLTGFQEVLSKLNELEGGKNES